MAYLLHLAGLIYIDFSVKANRVPAKNKERNARMHDPM